MKTLLVLMGIGALAGIGSFKWKAPESVMLEEFRVYKGSHCESSAMLNLLRHLGYDVTEHQLIGSGAPLGFTLDSSPFPFLGGRNHELREEAFGALDLPLHIGTEAEYGDGWEKIETLLREGTPVVLRVDMRYLPYLYGGKYGPKHMSFGWHLVCLAGIDGERGSAYVTDTEYTGLREIALKDLHRARFSDTETYPPKGEFYWTDRAPSSYTVDWEAVALASLEKTAGNMTEAASIAGMILGMEGMRQWSAFLRDLDEHIPSYLLGPVLAFHYGCIEANGTGGAAFRKMYHAFLEETGRESGNTFILGAAERLEPAVRAWTDIAMAMLSLSEDRATLKGRAARKEALAHLAETANTVFEAEREFYDYILEGGVSK